MNIWFSFAFTSSRFSRSVKIAKDISIGSNLDTYSAIEIGWTSEFFLSSSLSFSLFLHSSFLFTFIHAIREQARNFTRISPPSNLHNEQSRDDLNFESEEQTPCITQTKLLDESVNIAEASASKFVINLNSATMYISNSTRWSFIEIVFLLRQEEISFFQCFSRATFQKY